MVYNTSDIKHLEVMANLAAQTPAPAPKAPMLNLFDTAHVETLDEQILALCSKLRSDGFVRQADSLENRLVIYRAANTHLYRAIDEDGEDLIEFAHPEGEVDVADASGDLGKVETIVTKHRKIVDMVQREPTGKLAKYVAQVNNVINKNAYVGLIPILIWRNNKDSLTNQSIEINGKQLAEALQGIKQHELVIRSSSLIDQIDNLIKQINDSVQLTRSYRQIAGRGVNNSDKEFLSNYKVFCDDLKNNCLSLVQNVINLISEDEASALTKIYRKVLVRSDLTYVKQSLNAFIKALAEMSSILNVLINNDIDKSRQEAMSIDQDKLNKMKSFDPNKKPTPTPAAQYDKSSKDSVINKLKSLSSVVVAHPKMSAAKKQEVQSWIKSQIGEIIVADDSKLPELIKEVSDFESDLNKLSGK